VNAGAATYGFAGVVLAIVAILVVPLPPVVLDALLAFNVLGSGVVLLLSITVADPLEFAAFAPTLLIATLFRLALDVSATRLILTHGHEPGGAGAIIPAFGALVVGGNLVVGMIVFAILITIQFIVIASGSQRVAEVAARFTLDAMPGKQMAIDADVHAGALDAEGARRKRSLIQKEADFYGAMDGAGKFVKGDAVAALVIVTLNLIGGVAIGSAYHAMTPLDALGTFALLSIGNALVTTLPAFLLSTAMGLMVTRVAADGSLGVDLAAQVLARPDVLRAATGFAFALAFVPALPHAPFFLLGVAMLGAAEFARANERGRARRERESRDAARRVAIRRPEMALGLVGVDLLSIDLGSELAALLMPPLADALLDRIGEVRRALASDLGIILPGVRLRDDLARGAATYAIRVRDEVAGEGLLRLDGFLAVGDESVLEGIGGDRVCEPVYGMPAAWVATAERDRATRSGALVFDPISIIGSHLAEVARSNASALLGRQELQTLLEHLRGTVPSLVKEVGTDALPLATVHKTFELLLRERVWPRDIVATLQALVDASAATRDPRELAEAVRRTIVPGQLRRRGLSHLEPLIVAPELDAELTGSWLATEAWQRDRSLLCT
jgi:flagellar biosynthesis protein FlhA